MDGRDDLPLRRPGRHRPRRPRHHSGRPRLDPGRRGPLRGARDPQTAGCARYVVTDVRKDGTLQGPNVELLKSLAEKTEAPIVASGGVSSLEDLRALRELVPFGVDSAIVGKALYAGKFSLEEALDVAGR